MLTAIRGTLSVKRNSTGDVHRLQSGGAGSDAAACACKCMCSAHPKIRAADTHLVYMRTLEIDTVFRLLFRVQTKRGTLRRGGRKKYRKYASV